MNKAEILLKKQPRKYLVGVDAATYKKLRRALDGLQEFKGDIIKLQGSEFYRLKIPQYRIIFTRDKLINIIFVEEINTRTNINYRRYTK